jgi:hypothetical protein
MAAQMSLELAIGEIEADALHATMTKIIRISRRSMVSGL